MDGQISRVSLQVTSCHFMSILLAMFEAYASSWPLLQAQCPFSFMYGTRGSPVSNHHKLMAAVLWMSLQECKGMRPQTREICGHLPWGMCCQITKAIRQPVVCSRRWGARQLVHVSCVGHVGFHWTVGWICSRHPAHPSP